MFLSGVVSDACVCLFVCSCVCLCPYVSLCMFWEHNSGCDQLTPSVAARCNTLQNTPQHTVTHRNTPQNTATHCNTPQHTATHRKTLQHTANNCNTLQHEHVRLPAKLLNNFSRSNNASNIKHCSNSNAANQISQKIAL